ncbi:electron transport protein ygfS [Escherichia coli]|uniref:Electron transport protein ygfS n=1 Tax=Escherichia coli TaxID=562 RepID=A0A377AEE6_ECOLX|nr:electron transport protein ygfS [Escherichia coli]
MKSLIIVNPADCIGCRTCEVACVVAHPSEQELNADVFFTPAEGTATGQHQCENAPCVGACPVGALTMGEQVVQTHSARCIGCQSCVSACPFGMITIQSLPGDTRQQIVKCDLCEQREEGPACVESCPTQALQLLTERELRRVRQQRIVASGENPL